MSTLHEKLLAATGPLPRGRVLHESDVNGPRSALRAVVELHAPGPSTLFAKGVICQGCDWGAYADDGSAWPCSTIQAIARELGVDG